MTPEEDYDILYESWHYRYRRLYNLTAYIYDRCLCFDADSPGMQAQLENRTGAAGSTSEHDLIDLKTDDCFMPLRSTQGRPPAGECIVQVNMLRAS